MQNYHQTLISLMKQRLSSHPRVLGYFKSLFNINKNRKNMFQSMAKRHQFMMLVHNTRDNLLDHKKKHTALEVKGFQ